MTLPSDASPFDYVLATLHDSHDRLVAALDSLTDEEFDAPSYDDDWTIAQVASHLGSGAEIFRLFVEAGRDGTPGPGLEQFQPIWDSWNAKSAAEQARDSKEADAAFTELLDSFSQEERAAWSLGMFGETRSLEDVARMRLGEHALHTWDIVVARDSTATVPDDAAGLVAENLAFLVERVGKGASQPVAVLVETVGPERSFRLDLTEDGASLTPQPTKSGPAASTLRIPTEAFVRLVYGRLDPDHTPPAVVADGIELDTLRRSFPGV